MASTSSRYSLRSKSKPDPTSADEKQPAALEQPSTPQPKKPSRTQKAVERTPRALGKRKRSDTNEIKLSESAVKPSIDEIHLHETLESLKPLVDHLQGVKCHHCQIHLLTKASTSQHLDAWTSRKDSNTAACVLHCPSVSCDASTCLGCGSPASATSKPADRRIFKSFNHKSDSARGSPLTSSCCKMGSIVTVWMLLAYFDDHFDAELAKTNPSATPPRNRPKPKKASKKKFAKSWPKGVGYAYGYDDEYLSPSYWSNASNTSKSPPESKEKSFPLGEHLAFEKQSSGLIKMLAGAAEEISRHGLKEETSTSSAGRKTKSKHDAFQKASSAQSAAIPPTDENRLHVLLTSLFQLSHLPGKLAELLRNDSVESATEYSELYEACMDLLDALLGSDQCKALLSSPYNSKDCYHSLSNIVLNEGENLKANGFRAEKATPLADSMTNLLKATRSLIQSARVAPEVYSDEAGKKQLGLCERIDRTGRRVEEAFGKVTCMKDEKATRTDVPVERLQLVDEKTLKSRYCFIHESKFDKTVASRRMRTLYQEISVLTTSLPDGVFLKVAMDRPDMLKALIVGPEGTPYEGSLFEFDILCPERYPQTPPKVSCSTASSNGLRLNPNLYENGYVCLSLINTWSGAPSEQWQPGISTLLQVLVSIQSMIFVQNPGENEPGGSGPNSTYNKKIECFTVMTILGWIKNADFRKGIWSDIVQRHFEDNAAGILHTVKSWTKENGDLRKYSKYPGWLPPGVTAGVPAGMPPVFPPHANATAPGIPMGLPVVHFSGPSGGQQQQGTNGGTSGGTVKQSMPPPKPKERDLAKELEEALAEFR